MRPGEISERRDQLANSGSYARGDQPRSVPDADKARHDQAAQQQRAYNERQAAELARKKRHSGNPFPDVGHPGPLEAIVPIWGPGREALADAHDGDVVGAVGNGLMAVSDLVPAKAVAGAVVKGAVKVGGSHVWRARPGVDSARKWLGEKGHLKPGEHGHHWAIPNNGWGKNVPDWIKNQPWNIIGLDKVTHGRIHGPYTLDGVKLPQYGPVERVVRGTPAWAKAAPITTPAGAGRSYEASRRK